MSEATRTQTIARWCPGCNKQVEVKVDPKDFAAWRGGTLIQTAFPYLTPAEREVLITGYCESCWDLLFGDDDA